MPSIESAVGVVGAELAGGGAQPQHRRAPSPARSRILRDHRDVLLVIQELWGDGPTPDNALAVLRRELDLPLSKVFCLVAELVDMGALSRGVGGFRAAHPVTPPDEPEIAGFFDDPSLVGAALVEVRNA